MNRIYYIISQLNQKISHSCFSLTTGGFVACIQRLKAANIPPTLCSIDTPLSELNAWTTPLKNIPNINANPFRTDPAYLVTRPTKIPPTEFVSIGIHVVDVQPSQNPFLAIVLPSGLITRLKASRIADAAHSSMLNR